MRRCPDKRRLSGLFMRLSRQESIMNGLIRHQLKPAKLWGNEAYDNLDLKAAALLESIVRNHALVDGNKRLGWLATVVFFAINDVTIEGDDDEIYDTVIDTACGKISLEDLSAKLTSWHQDNGSQNEKYPKTLR